MLGSNVPTVGGLTTAFEYADKWDCKSIQIYTTPSRSWHVPNLTKEEREDFIESWRKSKTEEVVSHTPFIANIASSNKGVREKAINRLFEEIKRIKELEIPYLVLHPGSYVDANRDVGMKKTVEALNLVLEEIDFLGKVLLENMAGQGTSLGYRFEEISKIIKEVERDEKLGVCLDTAHLFQAGYDIRSLEGYEEVKTEFNSKIGLERVKAIHLNDSKTPFGSRKDRHSSIGEGELNLEVLHALMNDEDFEGTPKLLEIPEREKSGRDLKKLRDLRENGF